MERGGLGMLGVCEKACNWLVREGDTPLEARTKRAFTPIAVFAFFFDTILVLSYYTSSTTYPALGNICNALVAVTFLVYLILIALNAFPVGPMLDIALMICTIALCAHDIVDATIQYGFRQWTLVVLVLDIALVFRRDHMTKYIIPIVLLYLIAISAEQTHRFGLTDVGYWGSAGSEVSYCNCASPPCENSVSDSFFLFMGMCTVFLCDFYMTRGFATSLWQQLRRVEASVDVTGEITGALVRYDVDLAEAVVRTHADNLPPGLELSYLQLVGNLRSYRAYLPHSCLVAGGSDEGEDRVEEPSSLSPSVDCSVAEALFGPAPNPTWPEGKEPKAEMRIEIPNQIDGPSEPCTPENKDNNERMNRAERLLRATPRRARMSLAAGNMLGYLKSVENMAAEINKAWIRSDVEKWCVSVMAQKGIVDVLAGDRRFASFNARRKCPRHASAAVEVLTMRGNDSWSGCVVTGQAVCGSFGSHAVVRFMVLGGLSSSLYPFERIAARWRIQALADGEAYAVACQDWRGLLLGALLVPKRGQHALRCYSITTRRDQQEGPMFSDYYLSAAIVDEADGNSSLAEIIDEAVERIQPRKVLEKERPERPEGIVWHVTDVGLRSLE